MSNTIKSKSYGNTKEILLDPDTAYAIPVQVSNKNVTANADGRKILPAGTVLGGATSALMTRTAVLDKVADNTAQGILLWDLDVTDGTETGTMVVRGVIDSSKITNFTTLVPSAAQGAMPHIIFRNGEYN